jgi:hypothetical protein
VTGVFRRNADCKRWGADPTAAALLALTTVACTTILDLDADYRLDQGTHEAGAAGDTSSAGTGGSGPTGGTGAGGGATGGIGGGGASATGGGGSSASPPDASAGTGGTSPGDGGPNPDCVPGVYEGTFEGMHMPSFTVVGAPVPLSGTLTMRLEVAGPDRLRMVDAVLDGTLTLPGSGSNLQTFTGTQSGEIDCTTHQVEGGTLNGTILPAIAVTGTIQGELHGTSYSGTWDETEANVAYKGSGTTTASFVGP